jgi:hypothetical protein
VELSFSIVTILKSGEGKEESGVVIPRLLKSGEGKEERRREGGEWNCCLGGSERGESQY